MKSEFKTWVEKNDDQSSQCRKLFQKLLMFAVVFGAE